MTFEKYNANLQVLNKIVEKNLLALGQDVRARIFDRVGKGIEPSGDKFTKLAKSTIIQKKVAGKEKILRWTGQMMNSINASVVNGNKLNIGIADAKGRIHQLGIGVPARPILDIKGEDTTEQAIIRDQLEEMAFELGEYVVFGTKRAGI
jgi:phage gpG-like protein